MLNSSLEVIGLERHQYCITKQSRARVPIEGQCVLLKNSLKIKMFDFLLDSQNYRMNDIFLDILQNH